MRKINLFIDGSFYKGSGIGRYYESLLKGLLESEDFDLIYTAIPLDKKEEFQRDFNYAVPDRLLPIYCDYRIFSLKALIKQGRLLKGLAGEKKVDLFHVPNVNIPFYAPDNLIVTVHDLRILTEFSDLNKLKGLIWEWYFRKSLKKAKVLIAVSESVKNELIGFFPAYKDKIKVIYEAIDKKFLNQKNTPSRIIKDKYILYVGNRREYKNLSRLIMGFSEIRKSFFDLKLVIAGARYKKEDEVDSLKKKLNLSNDIIEFHSLDDTEIINLYKNAEILAFVSLYEGFGLPPLEAMAFGIPSIVSDIPVLKEVCGKAAYYINPYDEKDIAKGMQNVLTDKLLREELIQSGFARVNFFSHEKMIKGHLKIYRERIYNEK